MNSNRQYLWCFINIYLQLKAVLTFLGRPHPHPLVDHLPYDSLSRNMLQQVYHNLKYVHYLQSSIQVYQSHQLN
jgi:hypothetical protein